MFRARRLSPADIANGWTHDEFARFNTYIASTDPPWDPSDPADRMLAPDVAPKRSSHNGAPPSLRGVSLDRLRQAIRDDDLDRGHLKVLANLSEHFNATNYTGWPSRELIAEQEGLDRKTVYNKLYDLRRFQYIDWGRLPDPQRPGRTLLHYWWLQDEIAAAIKAIRAKAESALPGGQEKCPAERAVSKPYGEGRKSARPSGSKSALPAGDKELYKEGTLIRGEAPFNGSVDPTSIENRSAASSPSRPIDGTRQKSPAQTNGPAAMAAALNPESAYAFDNVRIEDGALVIGEPLRAKLRDEGNSDADIDLALPRALERAGLSTDPVKLLRGIRWALSYVRQDKAKSKAGKPSTKGTSRYAT
jgi:hypothetical protein